MKLLSGPPSPLSDAYDCNLTEVPEEGFFYLLSPAKHCLFVCLHIGISQNICFCGRLSTEGKECCFLELRYSFGIINKNWLDG